MACAWTDDVLRFAVRWTTKAKTKTKTKRE
jgi:hypothetical protein